MKKKHATKTKRGMVWVLSLLLVFLTLEGCYKLPVSASETSISANAAPQSTKVINVNITAGSEYLDTMGDYLKVDGIVVRDGNVMVEEKENHTISILPVFGYTISVTINGTPANGTENVGWMEYMVADADAYDISIGQAGSSVCTVAWDYDGSLGEDASVSHGTVKIISAVLPDGSNGIGDINDQNGERGHVVIEPGSIVTVEIKPDYGYQFVSGSLNGQTITAGSEVSRFTFTMPSTNLHLSALFTAVPDVINAESAKISSGSIANGADVVNSGNLRLEVNDLEQTEVAKVDSVMKQAAGNDEIQMYLNMDLYSVVNKGTRNDAWEKQLTDLNGALSVTLELANELKGQDGAFYVIREHEDVNGNKSYDKIKAIYDKQAGTITFATDKFSTYALVLDKNDAENTGGTNSSVNNSNSGNIQSSIPKTGDGFPVSPLVVLLITGSVGAAYFLKKGLNKRS